jgi:hypothetical protein
VAYEPSLIELFYPSRIQNLNLCGLAVAGFFLEQPRDHLIGEGPQSLPASEMQRKVANPEINEGA